MDCFTLAVVGGVLALVVAGLVAAAVVRLRDAPPDLATSRGVVLAYALAEQRGDGQTAWDLLASSVQARVDHDRFLAGSTPHGLELAKSPRHPTTTSCSSIRRNRDPGACVSTFFAPPKA